MLTCCYKEAKLPLHPLLIHAGNHTHFHDDLTEMADAFIVLHRKRYSKCFTNWQTSQAQLASILPVQTRDLRR